MSSNQRIKLPIFIILFFITGITTEGYAQNNQQQETEKGSIIAKGVIIDSAGRLIAGATVKAKSSKTSVTTGTDGSFSILAKEKEILTITCIGYEDREIKATANIGRLYLNSSEYEIEQVVVSTGMFNRNKETFSGVTNTITGDQLRAVGNSNAIQLLRTLDPSFIVVENSLAGSDPNALAKIEIRGKTSLSDVDNFGVAKDKLAVDPNSPLFILDGFESDLQQITDLDINRIASITLLKDAASTALYGSRAANGVVIVETIRPKEGELRISYTGDFSVGFADLRDYNMMNATEKLEFDRLSNRYEAPGGFNYLEFQKLYNQRLKAVKEGVNTYWLNAPLRNIAFTNRQSIYANGGSDAFQYSIGLDLKSQQGQMKGSTRKNWGTRVNLNYRKNKLNVFNNLYISGNRGDQSPYGSFATYVGIPPFYRKDIEGLDRYIERIPYSNNNALVNFENIANPFYNAKLNSEDYTKDLIIQNSLGFNYEFNSSIRLTGAGQISKNFGTTVEFISPMNTMFDSSPILEKGSYTNTKDENFSYSGNIGLTYNKVFQGKHTLTANVRGDIQESQRSTLGLKAVGFPADVKGNPAFAYSYDKNGKPIVTSPEKLRSVNSLVSVNYGYDRRYFFDLTYRIDGSTVFGTANRFSPFWATGLGWSVHNETFIKDIDWINNLVIKGNIGTSGNQNFESFASSTVYTLESISNYFGQGMYHSTLGNPNLKWQNTKQTSLSTDIGLFNNRLTFNVNVYEKLTDPLIFSLNTTSSNGIKTFATNAGNMKTRGLEVNARYSPIYKIEQRLIWTLGISGSHVKSEYGGFGEIANSFNTEQLQSASVQRIMNGRSPDDIWIYKSLGIDPSSGRELFQREDGTYTFNVNSAGTIPIANSRPLSEGILSSTLRIKDFTFAASLRYSIGASRINQGLYQKVENIQFSDLANNQDKRALELRWKAPGDLSRFKGIEETGFTPISSRFVQKEHYLSGESISFGYDMQPEKHPWLNNARLKSLRINAFMNNIFRLSNIQAERGIEYPFENTVSFSINASF